MITSLAQLSGPSLSETTMPMMVDETQVKVTDVLTRMKAQ